MGLPVKVSDVRSIKDRSNVPATLIVVEATVMALARAHAAALDAAGREAFAKEVVDNVDLIAKEILIQAPVADTKLSPAAAKAAAARIHAYAVELVGEVAAELVGK